MIRKSIYSIFLLAIIYSGFVYLVASGYLGQYEGPGDITKLTIPSNITSDRATKQNNAKNIVGIDIKAELPKKPKILINNDFSKSIKFLSNELIKKIYKKIPL